MTTEEKFNAAVNVIRNLPKNGKIILRLRYRGVIAASPRCASRARTVSKANFYRVHIFGKCFTSRTFAFALTSDREHGRYCGAIAIGFCFSRFVDFFSFLASLPSDVQLYCVLTKVHRRRYLSSSHENGLYLFTMNKNIRRR